MCAVSIRRAPRDGRDTIHSQPFVSCPLSCMQSTMDGASSRVLIWRPRHHSNHLLIEYCLCGPDQSQQADKLVECKLQVCRSWAAVTGRSALVSCVCGWQTIDTKHARLTWWYLLYPYLEDSAGVGSQTGHSGAQITAMATWAVGRQYCLLV